MKELEQQLPETHFTDKGELEFAMKKLQGVLGEFRRCFQEMSSDRVSSVSSMIWLCYVR